MFLNRSSNVALILLMIAPASYALEIDEKLSIGGVLAGVDQCQDISDAPDINDTCERAIAFQLTSGYRLTESDEVYFKFGFAAGNGLNHDSPFAISPWAADLEDDVRDINGRNRDSLLNAWYKHTFTLSDDQSLGFTMGIIDATDYLDDNAYANDEYIQFMNSALTNGPNVFLPSYDIGLAMEWNNGPWSLRGVLMDVGENDDGNNYNFYGLQAGFTLTSSLGTGNYRVIFAGASEDFLSPSGETLENRMGGLLSIDQELGETVGVWTRLGWQTDDAAVDYEAIYSGGIDLKGARWGREEDNIGVGLAYLDGGNQAIKKTRVTEAYYRWQLGEVFGLTADIQYQCDDYINGVGPKGWTYGLRAVAEF